jgi:hypothetical protein
MFKFRLGVFHLNGNSLLNLYDTPKQEIYLE